jgi:DNA-binding transcriptional ArsR family regulator
MATHARAAREPAPVLPFEDAALVLKALGHPLRLRLVCGLCREPSNLTRIVAALETPLSTVALHLAVLRRAGVLVEERLGAEILFRVEDDRVHSILQALCHAGASAPAESWDWSSLARTLGHPKRSGGRRATPSRSSARAN